MLVVLGRRGQSALPERPIGVVPEAVPDRGCREPLLIVWHSKSYADNEQTFKDYEDDQYDFHTYCMRRMTLSAYTS